MPVKTTIQAFGKNPITIYRGVEPLNVKILDITKNSVLYEVEGTPLCQYDQHSRARIGARFFDYKVSYTSEYVFYTHVFDMMESDVGFKNKVLSTIMKANELRQSLDYPQTLNLMTSMCSYKVEQTMDSLKGQMARRLKFCEEEFIVGLHWLLRYKLVEVGSKFKPSCDFIKNCDYSKADYLSNMFGCLFASCGRWPSGTKYATFNESCSDRRELEQQLGIKIPQSTHEIGETIGTD